MGPRSFDHGKKNSRVALIEWLALQWGRDLSITESGDLVIDYDHASMLQWGRDLSITESPIRKAGY